MAFKKTSFEDFVRKNKNNINLKDIDNLFLKLQKEPLKTIINDFYKELLETTRNVIVNKLSKVKGLSPKDVTVFTLSVADKYMCDLRHMLFESLKDSQELEEERSKNAS